MTTSIFQHAMRMISRNFPQALRASLGPIVVGVIAVIVLVLIAQIVSGPLFRAVAVLSFFVTLFTISSWIAVTWHRYILLEDPISLLPIFRMSEVSQYVWTTFLLFLAVIACLLPVAFVAGLFTRMLGSTGDALMSFVAVILGTYLLFRLGMTLPGAALTRPMTFRESWDVTRASSPRLWPLAAVLALLNSLPELVDSVSPSSSVGQLLQLGLVLGLGWLTLMVSISVLTTLYGHLVEGRALID